MCNGRKARAVLKQMHLYLSSHLGRGTKSDRRSRANLLMRLLIHFVAEQSAETHHEVISQYNELARTPMNFKLLDKVQDAYIPEGI